MKLFGLIAIVLITFSACQKENLRPEGTNDRTTNAPKRASTAIVSGRDSNGGDNTGGGIVDPNADQDSNSNPKSPKKGKS